MQKSLDAKLANIIANPDHGDFILADAKDADMGFGVAAPGVNFSDGVARPNQRAGRGGAEFRSLEQYSQAMREIVEQGLVDIMLMSASVSEQLTIVERLFDNSPVTPAARANDTTDIWLGYSGDYKNHASRNFRTATIDHIQSGRLDPTDEQRKVGADLGLYSITFNNDPDLDRQALADYREFRHEAERKGFRHFLEIFAPNAPVNEIADVGRYVNDCIAKALAGVTRAGRPLFLKMQYFGPVAMEQLVNYDPTLIPGILGGPAGTTHDAFRMLWEAKQHGARAALFGRKINQAECQLTFVQILRALADGELEPEEAVRQYHCELQRAAIPVRRALENDLQLTQI